MHTQVSRAWEIAILRPVSRGGGGGGMRAGQKGPPDFVKNHDSNLACDWLKSFSGMIIIETAH